MPRLARDLLRTVAGLSVLVSATLALAPLAYLVARRNPTSQVIERLARLWARLLLGAAGVDFEVEGAQYFVAGHSYVVVSNHISNLDPMLHFLAVPAPVRFLAKKELFGVPVFGPTLRAIGIIETDRRGGSRAHRAINRQVDQVVARGRSLVIYPEGTRSRDGELQGFKKGAFHLAVRGGLPVVPCAIHGTREAWMPGSWLLRGGHARVRFFPPIPTAGLGSADASKLAEEARAVVAGGYEELRGVRPTGSAQRGTAHRRRFQS